MFPVVGVCLNHVYPPGDGLCICLILFSRNWRRAKGLRLELPLPPKAPPPPSRLHLLPKGMRPSPPCPPPHPTGSPRAAGAPAAAPSLMRVSPPGPESPPFPLHYGNLAGALLCYSHPRSGVLSVFQSNKNTCLSPSLILPCIFVFTELTYLKGV